MERGVVQLMEGRQAWPLHTMGMPVATTTTTTTCFDDDSCSSSGWWEQSAPFGCFGLLAADVHDLFPLFAAMEPAPPPPASAAHGVAVAIPGELDDLLLNFWDAGCHDGDVGEPPLKAQQEEEEEAAFNSSCACATHEQGYRTPTDSFTIHCGDDDDQALSSIFSAGPAPAAERAAFQQQAHATQAEPLPSSSSSSCRGDPRAAGAGLPLPGRGAARGPARAPPLPRTCGPSLKRAATREESEQASAESGGGKRRKGAGVVVVRPFALLKPDGLDGGATLADINARVLMRPARPVRHPVGEFACAPRVSADQPGISGKAVAGFTRLHTPGRGSITIIRTRG